MSSFSGGPDTSLYFNGVNRNRSLTTFWLGTHIGFRTYGRFNQNQISRNFNGIPKELLESFNNIFDDGDMQDLGTDSWGVVGGATLSKVIDGGRQVLRAVSPATIRLSQDLDPDFVNQNRGKRLIVMIEARTSHQFDVTNPVFIRMRDGSANMDMFQQSPESSFDRYTIFTAAFVIHPDANENNLRIDIVAGASADFLHIANMVVFLDEGNLDGKKFEMKPLLIDAGSVNRGARPSNNEIFASFTDLEEKEISVSLDNLSRHFSDIVRPGPFRERLIGKISFIQQGFVEDDNFVALGHFPSVTSRIVFIGKCVRYSLTRGRFNITLREL